MLVEMVNQEFDLAQTLERFVTKRRGKNGWLHNSSTGVPGGKVVISKTGSHPVYVSSHGSDQEWTKGQPVQAFDLFCHYDFNDDRKAAIIHFGNVIYHQGRTVTEHNRSQHQAEPNQAERGISTKLYKSLSDEEWAALTPEQQAEIRTERAALKAKTMRTKF